MALLGSPETLGIELFQSKSYSSKINSLVPPSTGSNGRYVLAPKRTKGNVERKERRWKRGEEGDEGKNREREREKGSKRLPLTNNRSQPITTEVTHPSRIVERAKSSFLPRSWDATIAGLASWISSLPWLFSPFPRIVSLKVARRVEW